MLIENNRIPAEADSFDVVFSACVFHHIPHGEHLNWLQELHRITRPGGLIAIFEHNPLNPLTVRGEHLSVRRERQADFRPRSGEAAASRRLGFIAHPVQSVFPSRPRLATAL